MLSSTANVVLYLGAVGLFLEIHAIMLALTLSVAYIGPFAVLGLLALPIWGWAIWLLFRGEVIEPEEPVAVKVLSVSCVGFCLAMNLWWTKARLDDGELNDFLPEYRSLVVATGIGIPAIVIVACTIGLLQLVVAAHRADRRRYES